MVQLQQIPAYGSWFCLVFTYSEKKDANPPFSIDALRERAEPKQDKL